MGTLTKKQWALYAFSAVLTLVILSLGRDEITTSITGAQPDKVGVQELRSELQKIPLFQGDHWREPPIVYDKGVITGVTGHVLSSQPPEVVLPYYKTLLPTLGWTKVKDEMLVDGRHLMYCNQGISLNIDAAERREGTDYYFGLVWTKYKSSDAYCPQAPPVTS
ncbi:hypothetical protein IMW82_13085 [Rhodanobacter sp. B2A1Ga4]|uniref:hypothetical protein n=1 Tax=Rhodanobacter sp. B2A1Ga4 TaxID=2778647 RepID=UPI001B364738|nr:hypothetical protein [Rhodanobacter sp. B2A1Ga4]MBQ4855606.1 hypothetical protein [Rhodanobacter sp. B2A1Ga4]